MVLKEETADVVSFRESAHGEQMPRVQAGAGRGEERSLCAAVGWESGRCELSRCRGESGQANATSRLTSRRARLGFSVRILHRH